eukprot:gnl/TRDRNA2_/TRDRNA2_187402_c0_seq1.p1 gnl/TRDRNA2_/TRDRNA2_187402_c0~~gnl/TRDRNA2_/TRDRNA2_187402_c0_seq1.p1  ORF type:complete len:227 (+),score=33.65 gnl/TRDRNA2_/TRDRNA2_187402_c0_seq1:24-704(+)
MWLRSVTPQPPAGRTRQPDEGRRPRSAGRIYSACPTSAGKRREGRLKRGHGRSCEACGPRPQHKWETAHAECGAMAAEYGQVLAHSLLGGGRDGGGFGGFEDDPITYVQVGGWPGGPVPPRLEASLSARLAVVLREDMAHVLDQQLEEAQRKRDERSQEAFTAWVKKKEAEERAKIEKCGSSANGRPAKAIHRPPEEREAAYASWCRQYDARRRAEGTPVGTRTPA